MLYPRFDIQPFGPSSGTCAPVRYHLTEKDRIIVVENILMLTDGLILTSALSETRQQRRMHRKPQPAVVDSLERSLVEHADIWATLARH